VGLLALGVALMSLLVLLDRQLTQQFERNLAGVDLVLGAKGSPLQLVTSTIYHADSPTGNIGIAEVKAFGRPGHPLIEKAVPLALGDSYRGARIVGTTAELYGMYGAEIAEGEFANTAFEVSVGAQVAERLGLSVGDTFASVHGLDDNPDLAHSDSPSFRVRGILAPTGLVVDNLIITPLETVWSVHSAHGVQQDLAQAETHHEHEGEDGHDHNHDHDHGIGASVPDKPWYEQTDKDITALLAMFSARNTATLNFARNVNENTGLMAATPAVVMAQFSAQVASAEDLIRALAYVLVFASLISLLLILLNALRERRGELKLLRALGGSPSFVFGMVLLESMILAVAGVILGLLLGRVGFLLLSRQLAGRYPVGPTSLGLHPFEIYVVLLTLGAALLAALYPAWRAYRTDVAVNAD